MIIEFTVGNFLSFNEKRTISFEVQGGVSELKDNYFTVGKVKFLRSLVLYGANSSGKSNLIKAIDRMKLCLFQSIKLNFNDAINGYTPFLLSEESKAKPTFFEIVFLDNGKIFRYGYEYTRKEIVNEWLFTGRNKSEKALFIRTLEGIGVSDTFEEGKGLEEKTNDNRLFLAKVADDGGTISKQIMNCFSNYNVLSGVEHVYYSDFSLDMFEQHSNISQASLNLFQELKLGFKDVEVVKTEIIQTDIPDGYPEQLKTQLIGKQATSLNTVHNVYNKKGKVISTTSWKQKENESEGTKKVIDLSGPIFDTLSKGKILVIDEFDSKLHPLITIKLIKLFNSSKTNPNNAQLLFATHDTNLLSTDIFRRDQVWFAEKDSVEQTDLYALNDFVFPDGTKVRKDANLEKNYIAGRYGAIPYITNF
jgi:AAA15 family ATPase/GTPase